MRKPPGESVLLSSWLLVQWTGLKKKEAVNSWFCQHLRIPIFASCVRGAGWLMSAMADMQKPGPALPRQGNETTRQQRAA